MLGVSFNNSSYLFIFSVSCIVIYSPTSNVLTSSKFHSINLSWWESKSTTNYVMTSTNLNNSVRFFTSFSSWYFSYFNIFNSFISSSLSSNCSSCFSYKFSLSISSFFNSFSCISSCNFWSIYFNFFTCSSFSFCWFSFCSSLCSFFSKLSVCSFCSSNTF